MNRIQKAIIPAILFGSGMIIMLTRLIASPQFTVQAYSEASTPAPVVEQAPAAEPEQPVEAAAAEPQAEVAAMDSNGDACSLGSGFPDSVRQWCSLIEAHANNHALDPNLIAAVILQESGGNPDAYSKSGAVGLMQVMPRDGLAASFICASGNPCFMNRPSMDELYDPAFNVEYGTRMLAGLIQKRGSVRDALMSYGPMDVGYYYADLVLDLYNSYR
jgi:soluble lytic murein transglycosylase-like protein